MDFKTKIFSNLETTPWFVAANTLANTLGNTSTTLTLQSSPSIECAFLACAPQGEYGNSYFYKQHGSEWASEEWINFTYEVSFLFPSLKDFNACQALEIDIQQVVKNKVYNFGVQFAFVEGKISIWNRLLSKWIPLELQHSNIFNTLDWKSNNWYKVIVKGRRRVTFIEYQNLTINDEEILSNSFKFLIPTLSFPNMLNTALQLDGNKNKDSYRVMIDCVSLQIS